MYMPVIAITTVLIWLWSAPTQAPVLSEKWAVASAQRVLASELDAELPSRPFAEWLGQLVGPQAGVNWQLNECGEQPSMLLAQGRDLPACAEVDALLPDGRKVVVMIEVGTFEKGITGVPNFSHAAIEQEGKLYRVRRLRDLPEGLREVSALAEKNFIRLAPLDNQSFWLAPGMKGGKPSDFSFSEDTPPAAPTKPAPKPAPPQEARKVSEGVLQGDAVTKAQPLYPTGARKVKASGKVEVQVTISEEGRVIEATALSGHPLLRRAAIEAAFKWVFNPTKLNGVPVRAQSVLTFVFTPP